jgi:hypothetical protein
MELLELNDGETLTFRVVQWQKEEAIIKPAHAPQGKVVPVLRVHVPIEDKPIFPQYWDITSKRAIAQIQPWLEKPGFQTKTFKLKKLGEKPTAHFMLEVSG